MKGLLWLAIVGVLVVQACLVPVVLANPLRAPDGEVVKLQAVDNTGKTMDYYVRTWGVPLLGTVVGVGSITQMGSRPALAATGGAGGILIAFWPSIMGSTQDQAAAATLGALAMGQAPHLWLRWLWMAMAEACPVALAVLWYRTWRKGA